ncbi:MAG: hypothetical protein AAGD01_03940 [Acidobacteriota bacterium]
MSWTEHHQKSERFAADAEAAVLNGHPNQAHDAYRRAAQEEERAVADLSPKKVRTLGISAVSVVSLYYKAGLPDAAQKAAQKYLNLDELPDFAREQLVQILGSTTLAAARAAAVGARAKR